MKSADVVIIGGGVMGASIAYHLAKEKIRVVLLERESRLGTGATGRCSGGVRHQFSNPANVKLSLASLRKLRAMPEELDCEIDMHFDGYLFLISSEKGLENFRASAAMQNALDVSTEILTPDQIARLVSHVNLDDVLAGSYSREDGVADPHGVTSGYASAAKKLGAEITLSSDVVAIKKQGSRITSVCTPTDEIATSMVVNAAGPWSASVGEMAGVAVPVEPYRRHVFITHGFPEVPRNHIFVIDFETSFYFHREGEGVLMGMSDPDEPSSFIDAVDWNFLDRVTDVGVRRFPPLAKASIRRAWAGLYEVTPDANPIIGEATQLPGFFLATGFSGHGFMHGPVVGELVADLILRRQPQIDISSFSPDRFSRTAARPEVNVV
jgi:sarcosine oxidase, subunit beta